MMYNTIQKNDNIWTGMLHNVLNIRNLECFFNKKTYLDGAVV